MPPSSIGRGFESSLPESLICHLLSGPAEFVNGRRIKLSPDDERNARDKLDSSSNTEWVMRSELRVERKKKSSCEMGQVRWFAIENTDEGRRVQDSDSRTQDHRTQDCQKGTGKRKHMDEVVDEGGKGRVKQLKTTMGKEQDLDGRTQDYRKGVGVEGRKSKNEILYGARTAIACQFCRSKLAF